MVLFIGAHRDLFNWYCCSSYGVAIPFSSFCISPNSYTEELRLNPMVGCISICLSQEMAGPFRGKTYPAPVCKHILASANMWGFDGCWWHESHKGVNSGWPIIQPLFHFFVPIFPLDRNKSGLKFLRKLGDSIPQLRAVPLYCMWSLKVLSPCHCVLWLMSSHQVLGAFVSLASGTF